MLDRTKEPGALGEPLYLDVVSALSEARASGLSHFECEPIVIGGRYGLALQGIRSGNGKGGL